MNHFGRIVLAGLASLGLLAGCGERPPIETEQLGYRGTGMEENINPRLLAALVEKNQVPASLQRAVGFGDLPERAGAQGP